MERSQLLMSKLGQVAFDPAALRIPVRVATVRLDLLTDSPEEASRLRGYFASYLAGGLAEAEVYFEVSRGEEDLWENEDAEFDVRGEIVIQRDFVARRESGHRAVALIGPETSDAIHNLLRWFLPKILLEKGAFLLHGAAAVKDGRGYVFFGQSGAGKSTSSGMIAEADAAATILGDDAVIVQMPQDGSAPWVYAAPLGCGYSHDAPPPISVLIGGMYALRQSPVHGIDPISPSEGVAALLASAMSVKFDESIEDRIDLAVRFAFSSCGIRQLHFKKDPGFWELVTSYGKTKETNGVQANQRRQRQEQLER